MGREARPATPALAVTRAGQPLVRSGHRGDRLSDALLDHLILANIAAFGRYLPGVDAVLDGADPAEAVADVEG